MIVILESSIFPNHKHAHIPAALFIWFFHILKKKEDDCFWVLDWLSGGLIARQGVLGGPLYKGLSMLNTHKAKFLILFTARGPAIYFASSDKWSAAGPFQLVLKRIWDGRAQTPCVSEVEAKWGFEKQLKFRRGVRDWTKPHKVQKIPSNGT